MIITLTTDFGLEDSYVGAMKGVILSIAPQATLVDISHAVPPQDIRRALAILRGAVPYYPPQTIHVAVIDPGVGSARRPLLVDTTDARLIGPDNGIFTPFIEDANPPARCYHLDQPRFWRADPSRTFHGRDIFAPVAAYLATGVPADHLGSEIHDAVCLQPAQATRLSGNEIHGEVATVDHFGNLITNIPSEWLGDDVDWQFTLGQEPGAHPVDKLSATYADANLGELLALVGSGGWLEFAVRNGNAAHVFDLATGTPVSARRAHRTTIKEL